MGWLRVINVVQGGRSHSRLMGQRLLLDVQTMMVTMVLRVATFASFISILVRFRFLAKCLQLNPAGFHLWCLQMILLRLWAKHPALCLLAVYRQAWILRLIPVLYRQVHLCLRVHLLLPSLTTSLSWAPHLIVVFMTRVRLMVRLERRVGQCHIFNQVAVLWSWRDVCHNLPVTSGRTVD